eukprot:scaffold152069_cov33-Tisochrysis_lutea.AAC.5
MGVVAAPTVEERLLVRLPPKHETLLTSEPDHTPSTPQSIISLTIHDDRRRPLSGRVNTLVLLKMEEGGGVLFDRRRRAQRKLAMVSPAPARLRCPKRSDRGLGPAPPMTHSSSSSSAAQQLSTISKKS